MSDRPKTGAQDTVPATRLAVVGTAGHIDHGKTALVRSLTGIDTDRLPQEKARGISIDLGFANLTTPAGRRVGIVDVPGHERFVRNMLAGASGVDLVILVVAADEGVMPQTREHFSIVSLLGIRRGMIVLTKSDLVEDPDWFDLVQKDVAELVKGSFLEGAPVLRYSARTEEGKDNLLAAIDTLLAEEENRPVSGDARLPVDRAFVVEGFGTVVTGTLWRGVIKVGETVSVMPGGKTARVRSIQVHGAQVEEARAGQRTAISLHGLGRDEVGRGDWVTTEGAFEATRLVTVRVELLPQAPRPLKDRARIRFHLGAAEILGRAALLGRSQLDPGESCFAQIALEEPTIAARQDRVVLRSYSPMATIGGGLILEPTASRRKRSDESGLDVAESGSDADRILDSIRGSGLKPIATRDLSKKLELPEDQVAEMADAACKSNEVVRLPDGRWLDHSRRTEAWEMILGALEKFHQDHAILWGQKKGDLKSSLSQTLDPGLFDAILATLLDGGEFETRADHLRRVGGSELEGEASKEKTLLLAKLEESGFSVPELSKLGLVLTRGSLTDYVSRLLFENEVVRVSQEFVYSTAQWEQILGILGKHFASNDVLKVSDMKELLRISRKHTIPLLEYTDQKGITIRDGDVRRKGPHLG